MSAQVPRTLAISAPGLRPPAVSGWLESLEAAGVEAVQIRCKRRSDREAAFVMERVRERETVRLRVLVNGRADLALIAGAVGVHLPVAGVPVSAVRACLGADALVGRSTHSIDELRRAADEGVDYVTFGPVWETPGKRAFGAPKGPAELARAARVGPPVLALGGVTTIDALRAAAEAGAWGVAGIRVFESQRSAAELAAAVREWFSR